MELLASISMDRRYFGVSGGVVMAEEGRREEESSWFVYKLPPPRAVVCPSVRAFSPKRKEN